MSLNESNYNKVNIASVGIRLASPEVIRSWSSGEITKSETINYRTLKPVPDGLYCEKIFGPTKDWECHCGRFKRMKFKGQVCPDCGVKVTRSKVRRERMGHIELVSPVSHVWYFKSQPSRIGSILDMTPKALEDVLYYKQYVILKTYPGCPATLRRFDKEYDIKPGLVISDLEYAYICEYGAAGTKLLDVGMGAEAIRTLLEQVDLDKLSFEINQMIEKNVGGSASKDKLLKRLDVVEAFRRSGQKPEWMILTCLPVLSPEIRPMVQIDGGRFTSSDLNELYKRVIMRNDRLKRDIESNMPDTVIINEKRMLQEAVDNLIDNGRHGSAITGPQKRPYKSLSESLKGKQGRFRQNLLGKRVDYSGRSVIVVGPELKIYQCGLPKEIALELFKPFVMKILLDDGTTAKNIKSAKKMIDRGDPAIWDALDKAIKDHPVLLNRAPTLHRLSIQAFEPVLVEGRAIKLHPLVCTAFNADFDGDQMAVHVPLSAEAQAEARFLMLASNNLLKPSDGKPVTVPTQDMILGSYYLSKLTEVPPEKRKIYRDVDEAKMAYDAGDLDLHEQCVIRMTREVNGKPFTGKVVTSLGRIIFNDPIPQDLGFIDRTIPGNELRPEVDELVTKKVLGKIIDRTIAVKGISRTAVMLDEIKRQGYKFSTVSGITVSVFDAKIPASKQEYIAETQRNIDKMTAAYGRGKATQSDYDRFFRTEWDACTTKVTKDTFNGLDADNPIYMMVKSGARGSEGQLGQLAGMRGLVNKTTGETIKVPIKSNYREGLTMREYFIAARGARKGLTDTALRTADSGYMTRRLVDVSHGVIIRNEDCGCRDGLLVSAILEKKKNDGSDSDREISIPVGERESLVGKVLFSPFRNTDGIVLVDADHKMTEEDVDKIVAAGAEEVTVLKRKVIEPLKERLVGRYLLDPYYGGDGELIAGNDHMLTEKEAQAIVADGAQQVRIRSLLTCASPEGACVKCYGKNLATGEAVQPGDAVGIIAAQAIGEPGTQLTMRTFHTGGVTTESDITQGLPRVEELFEARKPKVFAVLSEVTGLVHITTVLKNGKQNSIVTVTPDEGTPKTYKINYDVKIVVSDGDRVEKGAPLTEGDFYPQDVLSILGEEAVQEYIINEVHNVYRGQGVDINDKHIEVILRQMMNKYRIIDPGSTGLTPFSNIDRREFIEVNEAVEDAQDGDADDGNIVYMPAVGKPVLLGITKAALAAESFLSAASFQESTKVLTEAASKGKRDYLRGLKENAILGKLMPAGTGLSVYQELQLAVDKKNAEKYEKDFVTVPVQNTGIQA